MGVNNLFIRLRDIKEERKIGKRFNKSRML
jgi:hypothetical protein